MGWLDETRDTSRESTSGSSSAVPLGFPTCNSALRQAVTSPCHGLPLLTSTHPDGNAIKERALRELRGMKCEGDEYLPDLTTHTKSTTSTILVATTIVGGLAVILNGVDTSGTRINHLLMLDEKGVITHSRRLILNQFPRTISYNERTNTLFVTYKGNDYLDDPLVESEMIMANYSIYGDLQWQQRMSYKGDITDVVSVDQAYIIVGNYNEIKGLDGRVNRAGKNNTDTKAFAVKINLAGELLDLKTIDYSSSYFANKTYKVSDDCINFFGSMGAYTKTVMLDSRPESAVHVIMNKDLEILASTLK